MVGYLFFELIQTSIGVRKSLTCVPTEEDWNELYEKAEMQALVGVCCQGIHKLSISCPEQVGNLPKMFRLQWIGEASMINNQNDQINRLCSELYENVKRLGFQSCVLKGRGLAEYYPEELQNMRQSGDIDLWVNGERDDVVNRIRRSGVEVHHVHYVHAIAEYFSDVSVEIHFKPSWMYNPFVNRRLQAFYEEQKSKQFVLYDSLKGYACPSLLFNIVHTIVHINRHIYEEGIGLRQIMDLYFVLNHSDVEVRTQAFAVLRHLGLGRFVGATMYVLQIVFAMGQTNMLCSPNVKLGKDLLDVIIGGGNFGHAYDTKPVSNKIQKGMKQLRHNIRYLLPYSNEAIWIPVFQVWHWCWRKKKGYL